MLHVTEKLFRQQPIGVLLRPISGEVLRGGEALVSGVTPRSESVESGIMPQYHYALRIEPTPVWLAKWVGENGYPTTGSAPVDRDVESVNVEVYCDNDGPYGVLSEHSPDLPAGFDGELQEWVSETFSGLIDGDEIFAAASMKYEPNGDIVEFRKKI